MNLRFTNWYTQALGATLGIIACVYAYLNGFMFVYGNIGNYFDFLGFDGIISSYTLTPLCILTLVLAIIKAYKPNKKIFNIQLENINIFFIVATVIVGFMGAKIYFAIPAILITFNLFSYKFEGKIFKVESLEDDLTEKNGDFDEQEQMFAVDKMVISDERNDLSINLETTIESKAIERNIRLAIAKKEMAIDLLDKNANIDFITEITGLKVNEIEEIREEIRN
ncbi:hypothetical protein [Clostridium sp. CCUG 7971]|uniref:hypothetical protein n=1 Tax=Clostridium sp. CCUG 7971 TaxID=2811414 RepID=UPI001ABB39D2|nr:hypothetical protein [Clostridium sp. CCUG 7971]MBO3445551.1 hypothetical protein [Clostridium sp. CCUG 7971]